MLITPSEIIEKLRLSLNEANVKLFESAVSIQTHDDTIHLVVSDQYMRQWVETKCLSIIQSQIDVPIQIVMDDQPESPESPKSIPNPSSPDLFSSDTRRLPSKFNPLFTFDRFVVGNNNRFSFAAAEAVSKHPANAYNPLFIYGSVGIGKTHLLHAIANEISKKGLNVCLVTSEKFTNDLINSLRNRSTSEFKDKYRSIDVLLIDDIQFLAGKESTQEEFFHTFNELHGQNKQIVLTSDCPPNDIPTLQDRLKTRFSWGLTADIQPPELETRIAILRTKIEHTTNIISDDVLNYVATQFPNNVRELEGALNRITAYSNLLNSTIGIAEASRIIKDLIREQNKKPLTIPHIKRLVSQSMNISIEQLESKSRIKDISMARQICMYLCREVTNISLLKIGENFGNRDHTTVIHAIDKIKQLMVTDSDVKNMVDNLKQLAEKNVDNIVDNVL